MYLIIFMYFNCMRERLACELLLSAKRMEPGKYITLRSEK